jgi:hypothetical protein
MTIIKGDIELTEEEVFEITTIIYLSKDDTVTAERAEYLANKLARFYINCKYGRRNAE